MRLLPFILHSLFLLMFIAAPAAAQEILETQTGKAAWYGKKFDGRTTASGDTFDSTELTAAHPQWPFGTKVRITNLDNGRSVKVTVNDRGPSSNVQARGIVVDVSRAGAEQLGYIKKGLADVKLEVLEWGDP